MLMSIEADVLVLSELNDTIVDHDAQLIEVAYNHYFNESWYFGF